MLASPRGLEEASNRPGTPRYPDLGATPSSPGGCVGTIGLFSSTSVEEETYTDEVHGYDLLDALSRVGEATDV